MIVDLRSDTVTRPSAQMRAAMASAEVGDDVFADDPTVNALQERAAGMLGFEAALFFPSGTQSNLAALMSHCQRGDEYLVGQEAHTYRYEAGGGAVLASVQPQPLANRPDGTMDLAEVEAAIKPDDPHFARTRLLALENTIGGKVIPPAWMGRGAGGGVAARPRHAPGRRAHLQRSGKAGARRDRALPRLRLGFGLPVKGTGRPGRERACRLAGVHRPGEARAQDPRRRHAPGRHPGGRRPLRARAQRRQARGRPCQRGAARAVAWRHQGNHRRAGADQHGISCVSRLRVAPVLRRTSTRMASKCWSARARACARTWTWMRPASNGPPPPSGNSLKALEARVDAHQAGAQRLGLVLGALRRGIEYFLDCRDQESLVVRILREPAHRDRVAADRDEIAAQLVQESLARAGRCRGTALRCG